MDEWMTTLASTEVGRQFTAWFNQNLGNLAVGVPAVIVTFVLAEIVKGWVKLWLVTTYGQAASARVVNLVIRTLVVVLAIPSVVIFDFTSRFNVMTGFSLNWFEGAFVGTLLTGGLTLGVHHVGRRVPVIEMTRAKLKKILGVTDAEIDTVRASRKKTPPQ